jgi:hypothetical protein
MLRVNVADVTVPYRTVEVPEVCPLAPACASLAGPWFSTGRLYGRT